MSVRDINCKRALNYLSYDLCSCQDLPEDQCIFVRGFRVTRKLKILPPRLKGAAGPNPDKEGHDEESDMELIPIPSVPEVTLRNLLEFVRFHLGFRSTRILFTFY
jgi:hypothetical protein